MTTTRTIHLVGGLPRSGSTLLMQLLAQHPDVHVTPTSACHEVLFALRDRWGTWKEHQAAPPSAKAYQGTLRGVMMGYHDTAKPVICDKSRGWVNLLELADYALDREAKLIVPVRDLAEILASFEGIFRKNIHAHREPGDFLASQTTEGRCAHWASSSGELGIAYNRLRDLLQRGHGKRILLVEFDDLTSSPQETMERVWRYLEMEPPTHDFENVEQVTRENDEVYGLPGAHDIRPRVEPVPKKARQVLGPQVFARYANGEFWR